MPIWAVDSPQNRAIANRSWQERGSADAFQGITVFTVKDFGTAEANCAGILSDVDLHHGIQYSGGNLTEIHVIGARPDEVLRSELSRFGLALIEHTADGFIARAARWKDFS